jgi:hypothetical protein
MLSEVNNETLENISKLEKKMMKTSLRETKNDKLKKTLKQSFRSSIEKDIESFNSKSLKEHKINLDQQKRFDQLKDIFTLQQIEKIEQWVDLQIGEVVYDTNMEEWEIIGKEGSIYQSSLLGKEKLLRISMSNLFKCLSLLMEN